MTDAIVPALGPAAPTPPIEIAGGASSATARLIDHQVPIPPEVLSRLREPGAAVTVEPDQIAEASRDWWPIAMTWALEGQVAALAGAIVSPTTVEQVGAVLAICNDVRIPVTPAAGRSGVGGGSVPRHGGVVLDLCQLTGIRSVDDTSLLVDVLPGTFGDHFEAELHEAHGLTVGHWPQSMNLSTVGGWLACRGAGQMSTRYGKIEDIVVGLDVALADGTIIHTGGNARQAVGPDLDQVFVGSEGTLGVIVGARLRAHPVPPHTRKLAYAFHTFEQGLDACRRILRRGATPAVLRLYDQIEGERNFGTGEVSPLLVLDEGESTLINAVIEVVEEECAGVHKLDAALVDRWLDHRNNVDALEDLVTKGFVVDTMEITGEWGSLTEIYRSTLAAIGAVDGVLAVSAHQSHAYTDGACLYFTFAGLPDVAAKDGFYRDVWDAGTRAVLARGGSLSHHHGVGLNRSRFMGEALGGGFPVLAAIKQALDPNGILNPGKLGLPDPFATDPGSDWVSDSFEAGRDPSDRDAEPAPDRSPSSVFGGIEGHAVIWGTFSAAVFTVPIAVAVGFLERGDNELGGIATILKIILFVSPVFAGFAGGRTASDRQVTNGALAGGATLVLVQIGYQFAKGQFSNPLALVYLLLLGASLGCFGGMLAARWAKADEPRRPMDDDDESELDAFDFSDIEPEDFADPDPDAPRPDGPDSDNDNGTNRGSER